MILIQSIGIEKKRNFLDEFSFFFFPISLVIIGGDGSVINVINALIRYLAKQNRIK